MKQFIKRYCAEIATALFIVAVVLFVAPFVFRMQNAAGCYMLDAGGVCVALALCVGIIADTTRDTAPDADADALPDATPEYNAEGELVVNGRGVFDPFVTTFGEYLAWFFGWDNPANVYPYRVPRTPDDITADTLQTAFNSVGIYDPICLTPIHADANPRVSFDGFRCWDSVARFVRLNWHEQINVEVYSVAKEYLHVFSVDGIDFEFYTAYDWGAPIE